MNLFRTLLFSAVAVVAVGASARNGDKTVKEQMFSAKKNANTVLMVVTDSKTSTKNMTHLLTETVKSMPKVQIVEMNVDDKNNAELVEEYRLTDSEFPLLLIFSDKGMSVGGMLEPEVTKENIENVIPSPKYSQILFALSQGNPVFTVISNSKFKSNKAAIARCEAVKKQLGGKAEVIVVDTEDIKESKLVEMLNIKTKPEDSFIVAIDVQGDIQGYQTIPTQSELLAAVAD